MITVMNLSSDNGLRNEGVRVLCEALKKNTSVTEFDLYSMLITEHLNQNPEIVTV